MLPKQASTLAPSALRASNLLSLPLLFDRVCQANFALTGESNSDDQCVSIEDLKTSERNEVSPKIDLIAIDVELSKSLLDVLDTCAQRHTHTHLSRHQLE